MQIKDCAVVDFPTHGDLRGNLSVVDSKIVQDSLPFVPKRCFWIYGVTESSSRGEHAHRTCWEIVCAVSGKFKLTLHDGKNEKTVCLDSPSQGVIIPPMVWCRLWDFAPDTVCLTFASEDYDAEGYINDFDSFLTEVQS